jgi:2'-5' RNA ligase
MPRLFTAIEIPREIGMHLSMLRGGVPGARWIDPENYHITLRFVGDVDLRTAHAIDEALERVRRPQFRLRLLGLDVFGGGKPHSIFAGVDSDAGLIELQGEIERRMQRLDLKPDGRRFVPHVTLARLRGARDHEVASYLSLRGQFSSLPFVADRFVLLSSRDSIGGGPYVLEATYPLQDRASVAGAGDPVRQQTAP